MIELAIIGFIAALTPGPDIFFIIRTGLKYGLTEVLLAVSGILSGNIVYLFLVYIGLESLGKNPYFQFIVGSIGAIYLIYLAINILKENVKLKDININKKHIYLQGLILNLSNPKAMVFFAIIITPFLNSSLILSLIYLYLGIALAFLSAGMISSKINLDEKNLFIFNKFAALVFIIFSIKLFLTSYEALLKLINFL